MYKDTLTSDIVRYTDPNVDWNAPNYSYRFSLEDSILRIEQFVDSIGENRTQTAAVDLFFKFIFSF